ncbi:Rhomboid family protein [Aquisphaera giovannonii]|uniref:Rhomboid family protein n=1 Tax=Aquisphaera giovannonii TaxID=406548 RepID=A0A5B9W2T1_9BACT|nr:rhomboid family intramembrane serine protease [Aquisphaera giovannonii]QEH34547.1 Rhomboid family protein [Aquisphaera giovannonii]
MLVIPTGTDAPIYHWPYATVGMIVLNVALLFLVPPPSQSILELDLDDEPAAEKVEEIPTFNRYALELGTRRLVPVQWVTHNFLHYGFLHLAGNMLFLWAFGIVVEGKLGLIKFVLAYLAIGTLHGAAVQTLLMRSGAEGHAAGASAIIYGLLAVCMIWAPRNELNCIAIFMIGFRTLVFHWDLYYTTVALIYIGEQVLNLVLRGVVSGDAIVSEIGHLSGAFWGTVVGIVLLKTGLVDCEDWDVFSIWRRYQKLGRDWKKRGEMLDRRDESPAHMRQRSGGKRKPWTEAASRHDAPAGASSGSSQAPEERAAVALRKVRRLIDEADYEAAVAAYAKAASGLRGWPPQPELYAFIKAMHARQAEVESVPLMRDHCRRYPAESAKMRLKLAQVLMRQCQRPAAAIRILDEAPAGTIPADLEPVLAKLRRQAEALREEGVLELEGDD